jgi:hypothetical protein
VAANGGDGCGVWRKKKREGETRPGPPHRVLLGGVCGLASVPPRRELLFGASSARYGRSPEGVWKWAGPIWPRILLFFYIFEICLNS